MKFDKKKQAAARTPASQKAKQRVQHAPGGLKGRWMINSLSFVIVILAAVIIFVAVGSSSYYYTNVRENLVSSATSTASTFQRYSTTSQETFYTNAEQYVLDFQKKEHVELQFISETNRISFSTSGLAAESIPGTPDSEKALTEGRLNTWTGTDVLSGERVMSVSAPLYNQQGRLIGAVRYVTSLAIVDQQIRMVVLASIGICLVFLILVVASNSLFIKSIITPVQNINTIAQGIAAGKYGMRLQKVYDDEIGELCDTINYMSDEISRAERMKNDFISSVSHELRTPLTAIGGWGETLIAGGAQDPDEVMQGLEIIQKESRRLTNMVEELLDFARIESGRMKLDMETFDVSTELYEAIYMYRSLLKSSGIKLEYSKAEGTYFMSGDRRRIKQVFLNIIDNAAKYGKTGGKIEVSLQMVEDQITVCVRDWGAGIPEAELPFVKEKFYKGSSKQRGSGIGLAITEEIVNLHGGNLEIMSKVGEGTAVFIRLPAINVHTALGVEAYPETNEETEDE